MKIGDLVESKSAPWAEGQTKPNPYFEIQGLITDAFEDVNGYWMYEVTSLDPPERGWFTDIQLRILDDKKD